MSKFEVIEHTADAGIRAYGTSMAEVFENCALGMMSLVLDTESVHPDERMEFRARGRDRESLLVSWLAEILFHVDTEEWVFGRFEVVELSDRRVRGQGFGEHLDTSRHVVRMEVKAPTYHMLELKQEAGHWVAQVIFDV